MRIIISPAKKMVVDTDTFSCKEVPCFMEKTQILKDWICGLSYAEQKALWKCNDKIAQQNAERFAQMDLYRNLTPALLAYDGIQYTYMAPAVFEDGQYAYVQEHLRILSGFYGVVKPMEGVVPYRLEMQAKAAVISGAKTSIGRSWMRAGFSSILLQRNIRSASKNTCSRRIAVLPVFSGNLKTERSSRRACTQKWRAERWSATWPRSMPGSRSRCKALTGKDMPLIRKDPPKESIILCGKTKNKSH